MITHEGAERGTDVNGGYLQSTPSPHLQESIKARGPPRQGILVLLASVFFTTVQSLLG